MARLLLLTLGVALAASVEAAKPPAPSFTCTGSAIPASAVGGEVSVTPGALSESQWLTPSGYLSVLTDEIDGGVIQVNAYCASEAAFDAAGQTGIIVVGQLVNGIGVCFNVTAANTTERALYASSGDLTSCQPSPKSVPLVLNPFTAGAAPGAGEADCAAPPASATLPEWLQGYGTLSPTPEAVSFEGSAIRVGAYETQGAPSGLPSALTSFCMRSAAAVTVPGFSVVWQLQRGTPAGGVVSPGCDLIAFLGNGTQALWREQGADPGCPTDLTGAQLLSNWTWYDNSPEAEGRRAAAFLSPVRAD